MSSVVLLIFGLALRNSWYTNVKFKVRINSQKMCLICSFHVPKETRSIENTNAFCFFPNANSTIALGHVFLDMSSSCQKKLRKNSKIKHTFKTNYFLKSVVCLYVFFVQVLAIFAIIDCKTRKNNGICCFADLELSRFSLGISKITC